MGMSIALIAAALAGAAPQTAPPQPVPPQITPTPTPADLSDDIVVSDLRDINDPGSRVTTRTTNSMRTGASASESHELLSVARQFARCAMKDDPSAWAMLRAALDGNINSARQRQSQIWLVLKNGICTPNGDALRIGAKTYGVAAASMDYDGSYYDRGALYIEAIARFAPDLKLTKKQTADPQVQARLTAREVAREKFRLPVDRQYFEIAICLVRTQPELAVRVVRTEDSRDLVRLEAAMVNGALPCVGNAQRVYFDPSQFRFYIADAVYRWAVAVKGVDSLIPDSPAR